MGTHLGFSPLFGSWAWFALLAGVVIVAFAVQRGLLDARPRLR